MNILFCNIGGWSSIAASKLVTASRAAGAAAKGRHTMANWKSYRERFVALGVIEGG